LRFIGLLKEWISGNLRGTETATAVALFFATTFEAAVRATIFTAIIATIATTFGSAVIAAAFTKRVA